MNMPELRDKFHIYGNEFKQNEKQVAAETRNLRKARESKQITITNIAKKMIEKLLDEAGYKPDLTLKDGYDFPNGIVTGESFKIGMLMLLK